MEDFSKHLKHIRESRGLTVNQLGMYANISSASISRYESGERKPKPQNVKKLSDALKYDYEELMKLAGHLDNNKKEPSIEETVSDAKRKKGKELLDNIKEDRLDNTLFLLEQLNKE